MDEVEAIFERLKNLPDGQVRGAANEIGAYLNNDCDIPFVPGRNLDQLAGLIGKLPSDRRLIMTGTVQDLVSRFERANHTRATEEARYFVSRYDLEKVRMKDWPKVEYCEAVADYVVRMIWRMPDDKLLKDSVDCSWNEGLVALSESGPRIGRVDEFVEVETISAEDFEALWVRAEFAGKEGDTRWVDTTIPTDPSFEPLLGAWTLAHGECESIEFTLNGIVLWSRPGEPMRFFRYSVEGNEVALDPETGEEPVRMVLQNSVLTDQDGRRFRPDD